MAVRSERSRGVDWLLTLTRRVIEKSRTSFDWLRTSGTFQVSTALYLGLILIFDLAIIQLRNRLFTAFNPGII